MKSFTGWKRKVSIAFHIVSILTLFFTIERMVFDVFGQMWGTMLLNGMTALCTMAGIAGVCIKEKLAIGVFAGWNVIAIGLNIVVILIYNDVGLLKEKEHALGLTVGNDNWWRSNGIGCSSGPGPEGSGVLSDDGGNKCTLSYAAVETIHASGYLILAVITLVLSIALLYPRRREEYIPSDDESFSYVNVGQFYQLPRPHHHFRIWGAPSNTGDTATVW